MNYEQVQALFDEIDKNGDGKVSADEFKNYMGLPMVPGLGNATEDMLQADAEDTFMAIDTDGSGFIELDELWDDLELRGFDLTREQVEEIFASLDVNGDGKISMAEFKASCGLPEELWEEAAAVDQMHAQAEDVFDAIGASFLCQPLPAACLCACSPVCTLKLMPQTSFPLLCSAGAMYMRKLWTSCDRKKTKCLLLRS